MTFDNYAYVYIYIYREMYIYIYIHTHEYRQIGIWYVGLHNCSDWTVATEPSLHVRCGNAEVLVECDH